MQNRREALLVGVMLLLLAGAVLWSWTVLDQARKRLDRVADQTQRIRILAEEIRDLGTGGTPIRQGLRDTELANAIEQALGDAGANPGATIESITPGGSRTLAGAGYVERRLEVHLQGLTLQQIVTALHALLLQYPGLDVAGLHLRVQSAGSGGLWNAGPILLVYAEYAPEAAVSAPRP